MRVNEARKRIQECIQKVHKVKMDGKINNKDYIDALNVLSRIRDKI